MARKTIVAVVEVPDHVNMTDVESKVEIRVPMTPKGVEVLGSDPPEPVEVLFVAIHNGGEMAIDHGFDPSAFEDEEAK